MTDPLVLVPDTLDMVRELTDRVTHRERLEHRRINRDGTVTIIRAVHATRHPSLLNQLGQAIRHLSSAEYGTRPGFGSAPAARLDAIDALIRIDHEAAAWVRKLGEDDPGDTARCVRLAHALGQGTVQHDVKRWWTWARVTTGWDLPAFRPDNTCPLCGRRGGLRVRVAESTGMCVECHATWSPDTIGLLAEHIRAESEAPRARAVRPPGGFVSRVAAMDAARAAGRSVGPVSGIPVVLRGIAG